MMASITLTDNFHTWAGNLQRNVEQSVSKMTLNDYIRIIIVLEATAYCDLIYCSQPDGFKRKDHDRELDPDEMSSAAAVSPNSLRGQVQVQKTVMERRKKKKEGVKGRTGAGAQGGGSGN
jgi:hypothetical protein